MMNQHLYIVLIMLYDLLKCYIHICSYTLHACVALGKVWSSQTQTNECLLYLLNYNNTYTTTSI